MHSSSITLLQRIGSARHCFNTLRNHCLFALWALCAADVVCGLNAAHAAEPSAVPVSAVAFPVPGMEVGDLLCTSTNTSASPASPPEPLDLPSNDEISDLLQAQPQTSSSQPPVRELGSITHQNFKVAIFGDSHLAAGSFSKELQRLSGLPDNLIATQILPATADRPGVRLNVRKICVSGKFSYEAAYVGNDAAITPGPGLATAKVISAGTSVTFDLRDSVDTAVYRTIKLLYHQTVQAQTVLFSIDGGEPFPVTVTGLTPGPAAIEVRSPRPMSRLTIQFADEEFKWQGIELPQRDETRLTMDVFGYPGATVAGFQKSNIDYWSRWFANQHYDLVMLWFGTNEGNVANFDPQAYEYLLSDALSRVKLVFPHSACLLISPADRGVVTHLVTGKRRKRLKLSARRSALLKYSLIHSQIAHVQAKVAAQWGCSAYNLQAAMGGQGSAYAWSKSQPRKMATDLIHFTPVGYRELADDLARAIHWDASWFNAQRSHSETSDP